MKKVLFVATIDSHILNFHTPYLKYFKEQGYEVHVASKGIGKIPHVDIKYNIGFERSPYKLANLIAYKELKRIIKNNQYDLIHCHTPMGAVLTRLAAKNAINGNAKIFYTAHGFHFFKGAPLINWLIYYPIEKWLSRYTDVLITINEEDYNTAINRKFKAKKIIKVHGVGVDLNRFQVKSREEKLDLRQEYGYEEKDFILFYAAELNRNKHQDLLIKVMYELKENIPNIKLLLAGQGPYEDQYKDLSKKLDLVENIDFLGYRRDIDKLLALSDIAVASSRREGLPVNIMEAMATGLPLVVTNVRGHRDLVVDGENGYLIEEGNVNNFANAIEKLYRDDGLRERFGERSVRFADLYSLDKVLEEMKDIYIRE